MRLLVRSSQPPQEEASGASRLQMRKLGLGAVSPFRVTPAAKLSHNHTHTDSQGPCMAETKPTRQVR